MSNKPDPRAVFTQYFPESSVNYCFDLWQKHHFHFNIKQKRKSKRGDYFFNPAVKQHHISVNADLNPYAFLITFLHEVAHLLVRKNHTRAVAPHGIEWKNEFSSLLQPMVEKKVFPPMVEVALNKYLQNPKASTCSDPTLLMALNQFDSQEINGVYLASLALGKHFEFDHRIFKVNEIRRTRILCQELKTKKSYLISKMAVVQEIPNPT
jgi:SprT protein